MLEKKNGIWNFQIYMYQACYRSKQNLSCKRILKDRSEKVFDLIIEKILQVYDSTSSQNSCNKS